MPEENERKLFTVTNTRIRRVNVPAVITIAAGIITLASSVVAQEINLHDHFLFPRTDQGVLALNMDYVDMKRDGNTIQLTTTGTFDHPGILVIGSDNPGLDGSEVMDTVSLGPDPLSGEYRNGVRSRLPDWAKTKTIQIITGRKTGPSSIQFNFPIDQDLDLDENNYGRLLLSAFSQTGTRIPVLYDAMPLDQDAFVAQYMSSSALNTYDINETLPESLVNQLDRENSDPMGFFGHPVEINGSRSAQVARASNVGSSGVQYSLYMEGDDGWKRIGYGLDRRSNDIVNGYPILFRTSETEINGKIYTEITRYFWDLDGQNYKKHDRIIILGDEVELSGL